MCSGIYQSPTTPLHFVLSDQRGAWPLVPPYYASDNGVARICQRGSKARKQRDRAGGGGGWEGVAPPPPCPPPHTVYRNIFCILCTSYQNCLFCTLNNIIRGRLIVKWHRPIPYPYFLLSDQQGTSYMVSLCPLCYASGE